MRRANPADKPFLSYCLIVRNAAATLERTLRSIRTRAPNAEIVIVDTCSRDDSGMDFVFARVGSPWGAAEPNQRWTDAELDTALDKIGLKRLFLYERADLAVVTLRVRLANGTPLPQTAYEAAAHQLLEALGLPKEHDWHTAFGNSTVAISQLYADVWEEYRGPKGDWTPEMDWFDDAAAARNRSFELATGEIVGWIDADDELVDPAETERLLKVNGRWKPAPLAGTSETVDAGATLTVEEILRDMRDRFPDAEIVECPYLYHPDEQGVDVEWHSRERYVLRNKDQYHWARTGHEVLVSKIASRMRPRIQWPHHVFVHRKRWTVEENLFSLNRHYDVLRKEYDAGKRDAHSLMYLENFARFKCPEMRPVFVAEWYEAAVTPIDRYRALMAAGDLAMEEGFYKDAMEHFRAATFHRPYLPDAYFRAGDASETAEMFEAAAEQFETGLTQRVGLAESQVSPREALLGYRLKAAYARRKAGWQKLAMNNAAAALEHLTKATEHMHAVNQLTLLNENERLQAHFHYNLVNNEREGFILVASLYQLWDYLVRNDETEKAMDVLAVVPHNMQNHPAVVAIERWSRKVRRHLSDPKAYKAFYESEGDTGAVFNDDLATGAQSLIADRVKIVVDHILKQPKPVRVMEIGCFDGSAAVPILKGAGSNIEQYICVDAMPEALRRLRGTMEKLGFADKVVTHEGLDLSVDDLTPFGGPVDVAIFLEVIEHVPHPTASIRNLLSLVKEDGRVILSTPWGAYDRGNPQNMKSRDPRGHVRAMTLRDLVQAVEGTIVGRIVETETQQGAAGTGADIQVSIAKMPVTRDLGNGHTGSIMHHGRPDGDVTFYVNGALWEWNASTLIANGMGASEETIVFLGRELAKDPWRRVDVYGPIPTLTSYVQAEEIKDGVAYWPREAARKIRPSDTVVVSRAPSAGKGLDEQVGTKLDKILWLQDTYYDDLNPQTAEDYRKIVVLSEWHKKFEVEFSKVPEEKFEVIGNFLLTEHFRLKDPPKREKHRFVYASSPDRGLITLLQIWPEVLRRWPNATLAIFYGWRGCGKLGTTGDTEWQHTYRKLRRQWDVLRWQPGIEDYGMVSHARIAAEMQRTSVWAYPTNFHETFCSNAIKARAAGAVPVVTPLAALEETAKSNWTKFVPYQNQGEGLPDYAKRFVDGIEAALEISDLDREAMKEEAIADHRVESVLPKWEKLFRK